MGAALRPFEIEHVKLAARLKDAPNRMQNASLLVGREVVEHKRGEHAIKRRLGIWKLICKSLVEPEGERRACCPEGLHCLSQPTNPRAGLG